ncbi:hypothetical protein, partial [Rhizobium johnstonii]|uniref:hypothetical protein n=1 Tax=Rhizobium johnstonii TaxID=3019933 RepID=UPI003F9681AE
RLSRDDVRADVRQLGPNKLRRSIQNDGLLSSLAVIEEKQPALQINVRPLQFQNFTAAVEVAEEENVRRQAAQERLA